MRHNQEASQAMESSLHVLAAAQDGDEQAVEEFMRIIRQFELPRVLRRYSGRNVLVGDDDIESHFMVGCYKAMQKAKLDVGNPMRFICWKGNMEVANAFRSAIKKDTRLKCRSCGYIGRMGWRNKTPACYVCNSHDVTTWMTDESLDDKIPTYNRRSSDSFTTATWGIQVEEIRATLNGRVRQLFDMIVIHGYDRDSCNNYIGEIADMWGISASAVCIYLRKLRRKVLEWQAKR